LDATTVDRVRPRITEHVAQRWFVRPLLSALVLGAVLLTMGQLINPGGYLSTDVGGKVATLDAMAVGGTVSPDLGYWAESADPDGSLYPMFSTTSMGGSWVNVTTLPMLYVALPFYDLGGVRLALIVPVLGAVLAALAARSLVMRLGGDRWRGAAAFWVVGLASPATIYALSIWEHTLGLALMAWGVVAALDVVHPRRPASATTRSIAVSGLLAGLAFGVAASMRQEALVYGFVVGGLLVFTLLGSGRVVAALSAGGAMAAAALAALTANSMLEVAVLGSSMRSGRSAATAEAAGSLLDSLGTRAREALTTFAGPSTASSVSAYLVAAGVALLLWLAGRRADRPDEVRLVLAGLGVVVTLEALNLVLGGLNFVPGMLAATPLAGLGLARGWAAGPRRFVTVVAVAALPLIWLTQYTGGAGPQWGGRYLLLSGLLLTVVAIVGLESESAVRVGRTVALAGLAVTVVGVSWSVVRADSFARSTSRLASRPEPVLVFSDPFIARESGPVATSHRWLAATDSGGREEALSVITAMGFHEFGYVEVVHGNDIVDFPGWKLERVDEMPLIGSDQLRISTWKTTS